MFFKPSTLNQVLFSLKGEEHFFYSMSAWELLLPNFFSFFSH